MLKLNVLRNLAITCIKFDVFRNISPCLTTFRNTEKSVKYTTRSGVFLTTLEGFEMWLNPVFSV